VGGTDTRATMLNRVVGDGELTEVVTDHLRLDFNRVESLALVNSDDGTDHGGNNDHVAQVSLDGSGLLTNSETLLGLDAFSDESLKGEIFVKRKKE
jgi:hypothetical protein